MASNASNIVPLNCELIPRANDLLRSLFRSLWRKSTGNGWKNTPENGREFISSLGKSTWTCATCRQKELIESGNVNLWDLRLLNHVLQKMKLNDDNKLKIRVVSDAYDAMARENAVTDTQFAALQAAVEELSTTFADLAENVEKFDLNDDDDDDAILNTSLARDVQDAGEQFLKQKTHTLAINMYTEAIKLSKLTRNDLGELYVRRCELYLEEPAKTVDLMIFKTENSRKLALDDAKRAAQLCPKSINAYLSLGRVYYALNKYVKASKCIEVASQLGELPSDVAIMRERCRYELETTFDCEKYPQNEEELVSDFNQLSGMSMTVEMFEKMEKGLEDGADPCVILPQAHRCVMGVDCETNYGLGVWLYTKAAKAGNNEAKYSLGVIYNEGNFVERDLKRSVALLEDAANAVCKQGIVPEGVSEAQCELGIMRLKAKGMSRDHEAAIDWLLKSSENENRMAATVLGSFYFHGNCVVKDDGKAIQFWELGAQRDDVISMQSLAEYYLMCDVDPNKAMEWHRRALESEIMCKDISELFISMVESIKKTVEAGDEEMIRWEKKNGFSHFNRSMHDRRERYNESKVPGSKQKVREEETENLIRKERLAKLTNPHREAIIREHRQVISSSKKRFGLRKSKGLVTSNLTVRTKLKQEAPPQLAEVKSITFQKMDPLKDHVYEGFELKCDVIDEPTLGSSGVGIIVEDENGDVQRAFVYNISQDEGVHEKIGYGCKITILNPYYRIPMDEKPVIRVDDLESVIFESGPDASRCRYCGKTGSFMKCGECEKASYCSKECEVGDWKNLRHKLVCGSL